MNRKSFEYTITKTIDHYYHFPDPFLLNSTALYSPDFTIPDIAPAQGERDRYLN